MNKVGVIIIIGLWLRCNVAIGAVCALAYYNNGDECVPCETGYYCPGDDTKILCPPDTADWISDLKTLEYDIYSVTIVASWSWDATNSKTASQMTHCHSGKHVVTSVGTYYSEPPFDGTRYIISARPLWFIAANGYYLSPYFMTSNQDWYDGVKPCTNAPEHAHYTGAGTPDSPDGTIKDANDCPWECDDGFGNHNSECIPLCRAGISTLHSGYGHKINLYPQAYSTPALVLKYNDAMCYGVLQIGAAAGAINISVAGAIYHLAN